VTLDLEETDDAGDGGSRPAARALRSPALVALAVAAAVLLVGWWAWPTWRGDDAELDVLVVADGFLTDAERSVDLRVREEGWALDWSDAATSWCDDPAALREEVERRDPGDVVVSFGAGAGDAACVGQLVRAVESAGARVVVVDQPGSGLDVAAVDAAGGEVASPERFVGLPGDLAPRSCEWWEECETGSTVTRADDGALTESGGERVARVLVAALRG
jgi:hypothetical protein